MRKAELTRKTRETDIELKLDLDGSGKNSVDTGVGFLNHMLELFSVHSGMDLCVRCKGDTEVDFHHSVEDVGICLGQAFKTALGDKKGIAQGRADGRMCGVGRDRHQRQAVSEFRRETDGQDRRF